MKSIYKNISNVPIGTYQNKEYDLTENRFYIKYDDQSLDIKFIRDFVNHPLNPEIYDSPNYWPWLHKSTSSGSPFKDYLVPTGFYKFVVTTDQIEVIETTASITYSEYLDYAFDIIGQNIAKIFDTHDEIVVPSNGGIDSLVLLSYILKEGNLNRVRILNQYNSISRTRRPGDTYEKNKVAYQKFEDYFLPLVKEFKHTILTEDHLLTIINNYDYQRTICYATTQMFLDNPNTSLVFGFAGNEALLHHSPLLDLVLCASKLPNANNVLRELIAKRDYYSDIPTMYTYDVDKTNFYSIDKFTYQYKPWLSFNGFNGSSIYFPLGEVAQVGRGLDYSTVSFDTILNAAMCREIISRNVGTLFDEFIKVTTPFDCDMFVNITFDKQHLSDDVLNIPLNLNHNPEKLKHLTERLKYDRINFHTISVIKMLQRTAKLLN